MFQEIIVHSSVQDHPHVDFPTCQRLARHVAKRYGHCLCPEFVFSEQAIRDIAERIPGIAIAEALQTFDPGRGVKFTTYLYRFLRFHAIKEYRSILRNHLVAFDSKALSELEGTVDKGAERIETADAIRFYSTIPDSEIAATKRQYLPKALRKMDDTLLKQVLGALDREILLRLDGGDRHCDIRRDFERRHGTDQRKFYRSRCMAIARRGKFEKPPDGRHYVVHGKKFEKNEKQGTNLSARWQ